MLRFIKHNMTEIAGVEIYPIISLLIFSGVFLYVIYRVIRMNKVQVEELSNIPLEDSKSDDHFPFD